MGEPESVAIVGMAGRFPGAPDVAAFWANVRDGVESVATLSEEELLAAGERVERLRDPAYVPRRGVLDGVDLFAAAFFGLTPREAQITDPQHRLFLECAWQALEDAGHDPDRPCGLVGVFGGTSGNTYALLAAGDPALEEGLLVEIGGEKDYLTSRVSYRLNLCGPSVVVQSACSTSLVAVHAACQSLLTGECDMALAGGVSVRLPQVGYRYHEGGIASPDGRCRPFDADARGTVPGSGVGVVVLRRLSDAVAGGDSIRAVIRGSAVNNDGGRKIGFTAPSADGQAQVIVEAQTVAGVGPRTIDLVEAHGTGTVLGDPIEVRALTRAFRAGTDDTGFCALGSVKSNVGHLDAAAGVTGLIKAVLALQHRQLPPSLHFQRPNADCGLAASPFRVSERLADWPPRGHPRRAGVSAFGIGGTNAHVVLEEAPEPPVPAPARPGHLLLLSAASPATLEGVAAGLAGHLADRPEQDVADVAHTLQVGRRHFEHRRFVVCGDRDEAVASLGAGGARPGTAAMRNRSVVFLFPGQGAQHAGMGAGLYRHEPCFREWVDRSCDLLVPLLGVDLRELLFPLPAEAAAADELLRRTAITQPALFVVESALARTWMAWGVQPRAMIGHSVGEYAAAHLAGVLSLEDALRLVAARGRLVQESPEGAMLSVRLGEEETLRRLPAELSLAAVNAPEQCVVSGPELAVAALERELEAEGMSTRRLRVSHANHSPMLDPAVPRLVAEARRVRLSPPRVPFVSGVTGDWATAVDATEARYWGRQLREPVRFAHGLRRVLQREDALLLEVGPGTTLTTLVRQQAAGHPVVPSMRRPDDPTPDRSVLLAALGQVWQAGVPVDWTAFAAPERRRRVPLPGHPLERQSYWLGRAPAAPANGPAEPAVPDSAPDRGPATAFERHVAGVWRDLIGAERIDRDDDFFELGGDSLLVTMLAARLVEVFGVEVPLRTLFDAPTLAGMAGAIESLLLERLDE